MPNGRYAHHDTHDHLPLGEERFSCAPGPAGWRYVSKTYAPDGSVLATTDLTLDSRSRPLRLELRSGGWLVRGGAVDGVTWVRTAADGNPEHAAEGHDRAHGFTGSSPAFLIATARLLRLKPGSSSRVRLVAFTDPVLAPRTLDQGWLLESVQTHETDSGPLQVEQYQVADLETGEQQIVHLAGDVVLAASGIELEELESPPNQWPTEYYA
ncbi:MULTISPECIES: hypothetical protein [unclassified Kitasatospora]|uniref:hypothetical protein n=1 Tax=unclassified Kitasatospora TaxID=2633591 RepID=UPI00070CCE62|nr:MULTISPECIES: hypothetical protein [unclassified Kitasatospora]KQV19742.1 hypothetical protein ASC99_22295 [Kitasatospora sp. Root107]KRB70728.1 hypothetical protein ASE03_25145 [Kitasatospora sp. Root187]